MSVLILTHAACVAHDPGPHHPECPDRWRAVTRALEAEAFSTLPRAEAPRATREQILRVHPEAYLEAILGAAPAPGDRVALDADTIMSHGSIEAALRSAGAAVAAVDAVCTGPIRHAFCATRPPGHHAEPARPMGFCLFANAAIAARHAQAVHGLTRVAVADFDVHHGNGTQSCFEADGITHAGIIPSMAALSGDWRAAGKGGGQYLQRHAAAWRRWRGVSRRVGEVVAARLGCFRARIADHLGRV
jgi:acetoin utilization deacetylase AcuC-like enzyme